MRHFALEKRVSTQNFMEETAKEVEEIVKVIAKYQWIINCSLVGFFKDNVWNNIPSVWVDHLLSLTPFQLNELPFGSVVKVLPSYYYYYYYYY